MIRLLYEINNYRSALFTLIDVNIKTTVATTRLGWIWWIVNPLVMMGLYYFFVNVVMERGGSNYHIFVLTGLVAWQAFSTALTGTVAVISNNKQLIRQVALPISTLIGIPIVVQLFFNSIGIIIILIWNYAPVGMHSFAVIPLLVLIGLVVYGLGLFLSVINIYIQDTKQIMKYVLRAGFFLSPILFPASKIMDSTKVPDIAKTLFTLNPMSWIITALRTVLIDGQIFNWYEFCVMLFISLIIIQAGLFWLRINASQIIKML